jgi:phosphatidylserine/phosphatidylglycerophosphate/cardiolipin synthase-like enzyme
VLFGTDLVEKYGSDTDNGNPTPVAETNPDWYEIYFTNPTCPPENERAGGLDEFIAEDISQAQLQVDVAAYDLDAVPIINALIDLRARGITVRVVTDSDNGNLPGIRRLRNGGISVVEDKRTALMHDKFIVVDGRYVWMGSLNFTTNGAYCNNNNLVRFDSSRLAANYTAEMDEMYNDKLFGPDSTDATPSEQLTINGIQIENYFGSEKEISPIIARAVARAQEEILFMAFSFTDEQIGEAMMGRADAGVTLQGVFETVGADTGSSYFPYMAQAEMTTENIAVRTDGNPQIMHHKVIIIDRETVIFGSYNFSDSANNRNDENVIIVHDPAFAGYFVDEFDAVWAEADNPSQ